mgnify:CR=1 FL=1
MISSFAYLSLAMLLSFLGMVFLALSQAKHWRVITAEAETPPAMARPAGWALLFAALVPCILRDGASFAALTWPLLLAVAALTVSIFLAFCPARIRPFARLLGGNTKPSRIAK